MRKCNTCQRLATFRQKSGNIFEIANSESERVVWSPKQPCWTPKQAVWNLIRSSTRRSIRICFDLHDALEAYDKRSCEDETNSMTFFF